MSRYWFAATGSRSAGVDSLALDSPQSGEDKRPAAEEGSPAAGAVDSPGEGTLAGAAAVGRQLSWDKPVELLGPPFPIVRVSRVHS